MKNPPTEIDIVEVEVEESLKKVRLLKRRGGNLRVLPVGLSEALAALMPGVKTTLREKRFTDFLQGDNFWGENLSRTEAKSKMQAYKQDGIPYYDLADFAACYPRWWAIQFKTIKASNRKGKQGRVIRRNDKRKGARSGNIIDALKKKP
jgi:hypothetical protein